jgi:hypothetical protein
MKIARFIITAVLQLPSGEYGAYCASGGRVVWTKSFGYEPGDNIELYWDETGPKKLIINGIEKDLRDI